MRVTLSLVAQLALPDQFLKQTMLLMVGLPCPLLAQSGHHTRPAECPLSGVKWTSCGFARLANLPTDYVRNKRRQWLHRFLVRKSPHLNPGNGTIN
jgi:hypothetical protein